jgi:hypothetical protein
VGVQHLRQGGRRLPAQSLAFLYAVELAHLRCNHPILAFDASLVGTSKSVYAAFGAYAGHAENAVDLLVLLPGIDQLAKLQAIVSLSRRFFTARSTVDRVGGVAAPVLSWLGIDGETDAGAVGREGLDGAALQFRIQADRVGLLVTGDARASVAAILRSSSSSQDLADRVEIEGLAKILAISGEGALAPDEALRITALVAFAAAGELP